MIRYYGALPENVKVVGNRVCGEMDFLVDWTGFLATPDESLTAFPFQRWKSPCHEYFANLCLDLDNPDPRPVCAFTRQYGLLDWNVDVASGRFWVDVMKLASLQKLVREAWTNKADALREIEFGIEAGVKIRGGEVEIAVGDLWSLIRILLLRDLAEGRAKVCANADCPHPYFLLSRKGQKYCRHDCAVLVNVRRFRQRQRKPKPKKARR